MVRLLELTALAVAICRGSAQNYYGPEDPRVEVAFSLDHPTNGVATANGRIFHTWARADGSKGAQLGEFNLTTNTSTPYPNAAWNSYYLNTSADPSTVFFHVNSVRIGPDGKSLWAIDVGSPGEGIPNVPGGPKAVQIDIDTNEVTRVYDMTNFTWTDSFVDDIRFHPPSQMAYLTDAGYPALWLLNLTTGDCLRVLENDKSTTGFFPASGEGKLMHTPWWSYQYYYADQMEVSPDGEWFYFQPDSGGMSRVAIEYLNMAFQNKTWGRDNLSKMVEPYSLTPATGGTAIDADGNVYVSDVNSQRILKVYPNATSTILVQDPRLLWIDAMWIDSNQKLWMPAAQLNRGVNYNNGTNYIQYPLYVYTMDIGIGPSPLDHP